MVRAMLSMRARSPALSAWSMMSPMTFGYTRPRALAMSRKTVPATSLRAWGRARLMMRRNVTRENFGFWGASGFLGASDTRAD